MCNVNFQLQILNFKIQFLIVVKMSILTINIIILSQSQPRFKPPKIQFKIQKSQQSIQFV